MRVKRYIVDTLPDAVHLIRTELGKDAVILETKDVKVGGFLGMFKTKKLEVLAAVEPNSKVENEKKKLDKNEVERVVEQILKASQINKTMKPATPLPVMDGQTEVQVNHTALNTNDIKPIVRDTNRQNQVPNLMTKTYKSNSYSNQAESKMKDESTFFDEPEQVLENINIISSRVANSVQIPLSKSNEEVDLSKTEAVILKELKQLRQDMKAMSRQNDETLIESENITSLRQHLSSHEFNDEWLNTLCQFIQDVESHEQRLLDIEEVWTIAKKQLIEWLIPFSKASIEQTTKVIQLVGPTGVGKTTTIAKLAAKYTIQKNKRVGFISADTYRIAAVDQLKTYANILNLPVEVVFSAADLPRAYKGLEQCEFIIMDTAGRNYKSDLFVSEVNSLISSTQFSEGILVVSLTSRTRDMAIVGEKFSKFGIRKVIFTKLDEAHSYGSIFNMIMQFGLQPIYVTSGQNVPDDIERFNIDNYVNLLLGEPNYE